MLVYRVKSGAMIRPSADASLLLLRDFDWDELFTGEVSLDMLRTRYETGEGERIDQLPTDDQLLPPIGTQEVWAAGVTYLRSRTARMEESSQAGGSDFYDLVYNAHRPELFFKAAPHRVVGHRQAMRLRGDSKWMVPEPEMTLAFTNAGRLIGFTIGNDLSSRDIEGENPLYLPQAKVFDRCAALGPGLWLSDRMPPAETTIELAISRGGDTIVAGDTSISQMKQTFDNLREHLVRDNSFPSGCFLMTGTGIVPPDNFTLQSGDEVAITIEPIGTLVNPIE
jgi:2-dehydro-3-deoxy-D-arabinonate dehydratase